MTKYLFKKTSALIVTALCLLSASIFANDSTPSSKIELKTNEIRSAFVAESGALQAMIDSIENGIKQIENLDKMGSAKIAPPNYLDLYLSCPKMAETLAMIAAGQIDPTDAKVEILVAITGDLGHDVSFGLHNNNADTKVTRRSVKQRLQLTKNVTWDDIIDNMNVAIIYMEERIRLNNLAF